jgi:prevent-host-death family protein
MPYEIVVHELAVEELAALRPFDQRRIITEIRMKSIAAKELKANLDAVLSSAQGERIVISRNGKPCAVLVGIEDYDAEDLRLASSQDFWQMIRTRRTRGRSIPLSEVESRLESTSRRPASKRAPPKRAKKSS